MSVLKNLSDTVKGLLSRKDTQLPGFLGNLSGTVKADDANNVYVTLFGGEVRVVYNGKVPNVPRLPVIIGYAPNSNQLEILGARDVFTKPPYPEVPPHAMLHTFPGADTIPIRGEQFLPGLITPAGGLTVKVYGMAYQIAGVWYVLATQEVDLTSEVPASGALMALLQVDDTGTINITAGTAVDSRSELGFDDIPAGDADQYTLGAVKLYNGQDRILFTVTDTDIVDLRWGRESAVDIATLIHASASDTAPEDTDEFGFWDSVTGLLNKITWANIKATLVTYFDTLYAALTHSHGTSEIVVATLKNPPADADSWLINDVAGGDVPKRSSFTVARAYMRALFDTLYETINGWFPVSETWTRTGNHTFTVSGDLTAKYKKGRFVRYRDGGGDEYGVIHSSSHSSGTTTVNLVENTDYAMAAATITNTYIALTDKAEGMPKEFNFTPSPTNLTLGNATVLARWRNDLSFFRVHIVLGSTSSVGGSITMATPFDTPTIIGYPRIPVGIATYLDASPLGTTLGNVVISAANTILLQVVNAGGTYATISALSGAIPFTWTTSDEISFFANIP